MDDPIYPRLQIDALTQDQIMVLSSSTNEPIHVYTTGQILLGDDSIPLQKRLSQKHRSLIDWIDSSVSKAMMNPIEKKELEYFWGNARQKHMQSLHYGFTSLNQIPRRIQNKYLSLGLSSNTDGGTVQVHIEDGLVIPLGQRQQHSSGMIVNKVGQILYVDGDESEGLTARFIDFQDIKVILKPPMVKQFFRMVETAKEVMARAVMISPDIVEFWENIWPLWQHEPEDDWLVDVERFINKGSRVIDRFLEGGKLSVEPIQNPIAIYDTAQKAAEVMVELIKELQKNPGETGRHRRPTETLSQKSVIVQYVDDFLKDRQTSLLPNIPFGENFLKELIPKLDHLVRQQPQGTRYFLMLEYLNDLTIKWLIIPPDQDFALDPAIVFHRRPTNHKEARWIADILYGAWQFIHHADRSSIIETDALWALFSNKFVVSYSEISRLVEIKYKRTQRPVLILSSQIPIRSIRKFNWLFSVTNNERFNAELEDWHSVKLSFPEKTLLISQQRFEEGEESTFYYTIKDIS